MELKLGYRDTVGKGGAGAAQPWRGFTAARPVVSPLTNSIADENNFSADCR